MNKLVIRRTILPLALTALLAPFTTTANDSLTQYNESNFLPVEQAFIPSFSVEQSKGFIIWQIAPDYYLYQHSIQLVINGQVDNEASSNLEKSPGLRTQDAEFGLVEVYFNQAVAAIPIEFVEKHTSVEIEYQGCASAGLCYPKQRFALHP